MSSDSHDVVPMVKTYKKLFLYLSIITAIGIVIAVLHVPMWFVLLVGIVFISAKSFVVFESFKGMLKGRYLITMILVLTILTVIGLLFLPVLNHEGYIVGTQDISKQLMMEQKE